MLFYDIKTLHFYGAFCASGHSKKYAKEVKAFLQKKLAQEKKERLDKLMGFAGIANGDTNNKSFQQLKADKSNKYK